MLLRSYILAKKENISCDHIKFTYINPNKYYELII